jgi:hypothetical protein
MSSSPVIVTISPSFVGLRELEIHLGGAVRV